MITKREFTAIYQKRGKWFVAWVEEIPGVNTQGRTKKEAQENLKEALILILEANKKLTKDKSHTSMRESLQVAVSV